ncbi:MAG: zinc-binding alcohol dehydrogenase family protein [Advenella sp.]|uniref:Alcohol dehydrogenase n=1 Tax=Advenella kashmirensis TaxID=310575 RepID=A0A356LBT8_9BURK|nr:zinc-binding alcohol dehydrogenase family protein [Advenella sp. FME57]HBP27985.1 hypothetical protein [Advenella kashmirensis]
MRRAKKAAIYDLPGVPDFLRYKEVPDPVCPPDGVIICTEAVAIEGGDLINCATSPPPHPDYIVGFAGTGEVVAIMARATLNGL